MRKKLLSLMPEFQLIQDTILQEKTINVWEEAIVTGNWDISDLLEMPFTLLVEQTPVNIITHTRAVTSCSLQIADVLLEEYKDRVRINKDFLLSGALLHDVGKLFEYEKESGIFKKSAAGQLLRHPISGAAFAYKFGLPQEVLHIIACHSKEGDGARKTVEAIIVNHADFVNFETLKI
ncbi:MAG: HD domain-containing protein [Candidatus Aminicenantaceae bacterium]|jgi:putative nucleotidyltransferase with HDIG domain